VHEVDLVGSVVPVLATQPGGGICLADWAAAVGGVRGVVTHAASRTTREAAKGSFLSMAITP
jgi:hypothetical protein